MSDEVEETDPLENYIIHPQNEEPNVDMVALGVFKIIYEEDMEAEYSDDDAGNSERPSIYQLASLSRRTALILNGYIRQIEDVMEGPPREYLIHLQYQQAPMKSNTFSVIATSVEAAIDCAKKECKKKYKKLGHCLNVDGIEYDDQ